MAKSKSSHRWLKEHFDDIYVRKAQKEGYRSRAIYKLDEIQAKDRIFKPGQYVLDLGAAPGGWSQYAAKYVGKKGCVIATDILPMDSIPFVEFVQGDFRENDVLEKLLQLIDNKRLDLVISDMAPNMSGMGAVDQPRAMYLCELALDMAEQVLRPGGSFVTKLFQGEGADEFIKQVRQRFKTVKIRKPKASRPRSREVYILGLNFRYKNFTQNG